ncbi:MAG: asparagine synthase (glutamine-hydrolyzing) [Hydrogenothermaceae bacterium]|nr:asparagine synthase (glutamine-hydrolyzing) [Hydrogenothermaceae bacterium]
MCGIAGIVYKNKKPTYEEIKFMTDSIAHRGPDGEGFYFGENFAFGHRRLAIIDLSEAGKQPMEYKGKYGEYVITYNGEIYNYIEIREELKKDGYHFNTYTDTEVIVAAYDKWGFDCLNKFDGMWAFVIYDKHKNILFGSRDRFGVKPFYYFYDNRSFIFASEIKALLKLKSIKDNIKLNQEEIFRYLVFGIENLEEEGFYNNILELFPSFAFTFDLKNFEFKRWQYYTLNYNPDIGKFNNKELENHKENVKSLIFSAIEERLRSDVLVGSCLSGGLDSSTIVCVINELLKSKDLRSVGNIQKVFTASYEDKNIDESNWAKIVVEHTKTDWFRTFPKGEELLEDLDNLVYTQEIPFGSTSIYAQYRVMKLAKENGVKVLLDGQGGDELFTGYTGYYRTFYFELLKNFRIWDLLEEIKNINNSPINFKDFVNSLFRILAVKSLPKNLIILMSSVFLNRFKYINREFFNRNKYLIEQTIGNLPTSLNQHLYQFMTGKNLKILLKYEDRNSMRFSIESRTPFADDRDLIEYIFRIPSIYKIHNGWSKYILREAMKGILPEPIRLRKDKIGFATPEKKWIDGNKNLFISLIKENKYLLNDFLNIELVLEDFKNGSIFKEGFFIWRIINLLLWRQMFKV